MTFDRDVDWTELLSAVAELGSIGDALAAGELIVESCHRALGAASTAVWLSDGISDSRLVASHGTPPETPEPSPHDSQRSAGERGTAPLRQTLEKDGGAVCIQTTAESDDRLVVTHWAKFAPGEQLGVAQLGALKALFGAGATAVLRAISSRPADRPGRASDREPRPEADRETAGEVRARFVPAGDGSQVGGDWFDVVRTPGDRTVLVVGDVVGHGLGAAVEMSELRAVLRRHLSEDLPVDSALVALNELAVDAGGFATCCCVEIGPQGTTVASAGHPPPIVAEPNEHATVCAVDPGPPLGAVAGAAFPSECIEVGPGSTVVLYSDGLVEQPGTTISDGIRRVRRAAAHAANAELDVLADHLLGLAGPRGSLRDDATVLVYRPRPHPSRKDR